MKIFDTIISMFAGVGAVATLVIVAQLLTGGFGFGPLGG